MNIIQVAHVYVLNKRNKKPTGGLQATHDLGGLHLFTRSQMKKFVHLKSFPLSYEIDGDGNIRKRTNKINKLVSNG